MTEPTAVGENVTPTVQLAPAARLVEHVLLGATANASVAPILEKLSATLSRFVTVTVFVELVVPTVIVPKFNELDENVTGALPVPESVTVCGLFGVSSVKVRAPVIEPTAAGAKVTPTEQLAAGARVAPLQESVATTNPALAATLMLFNATFC